MIINAINIINKYIIYMYNFERKYFIRHLLLLFFTRNHFPLLLCIRLHSVYINAINYVLHLTDISRFKTT